MLTLKKLRFKGIGRFIEEQEICFDTFGNLIQVDGQNNNTKGSSGSGKSTVFNALEFLFGLNSIPNTILQSRLTDENINIEGDFDFNGVPLTITRGKKLKIDLNGEITTGSSKLSEEKLDEIIAIPRHLFRPMLHKRQGEKGFFLDFTPKETNDFLTDCLGLSNFKKHIENLDNRLVDLLKKVSTLTLGLESAKAGSGASIEALTALGPPPVKEVDREAILGLKAKADASEKKLKRVLDIHKSNLAIIELNKPKLSTWPYDTALLNEYEVKISEVRKKIVELNNLEKDRQNKVKQDISAAQYKRLQLNSVVKKGAQAKEEALKLAKEIQKIRENICFTCEQTWNTELTKKKESELLGSIAKLREEMLAADTASIQLTACDEEIEYLNSGLAPLVSADLPGLIQEETMFAANRNQEKEKEIQHNAAQHARNKEKLDAHDTLRKTETDSNAIEVAQHQGQADLDRRAFEMAAMKLKSYEDARVRHESSLTNLSVQVKTYEEQMAVFSKELETLNKQTIFTEELKRAVKSYLSCSFDEALETIGQNSTSIIQRIPNMATAVISLEGTRETKDGKVKEEINAVINVDGEENVPIKSLSGGERSSVDLAIDMAVIDLIETRTNKGINLFILDEPFNGQDTIGVEMALEVLKSSNTNKKLIVVDHNPIVKEFISDRIIVIRDGEISHIQNG